MTIRERIEQQEHTILSPFASFADESRGRLIPEEERATRTCYQRDIDRIIHSKAFRRLMHKTQVFLQPEGDHYRTRMTHTLEVARIARSIACGLQLNEDLTEAMALGHDLGHTPFGHAGEIALSEVTGQKFLHNEQSLRVVDALERNGAGLNLCHETRMGIFCHTWSAPEPDTQEGWVIRYADRIAYINHDIDDAMRAGILCEADIPRDISDLLGNSHSQRINTLAEEIISQSQNGRPLGMRPEYEKAMDKLRSFMFERVYRNPIAKGEESKARDILNRLYEYYIADPDRLPADFRPQLDFDGMERVVCDYIAGMTDKYAIYKFEEIFIPNAWQMR